MCGLSKNKSGFNTQPPEGGCQHHQQNDYRTKRFQHTATRRWLLWIDQLSGLTVKVSTHSHPKVAAKGIVKFLEYYKVSTHSHPKVAAGRQTSNQSIQSVSTHSHPKVAAFSSYRFFCSNQLFQHTATRRWLQPASISALCC